MAADLSKIASSLGRETLPARLDRMREQITLELKTKGSFSIQEGGRTFTVKVDDRLGKAASKKEK